MLCSVYCMAGISGILRDICGAGGDLSFVYEKVLPFTYSKSLMGEVLKSYCLSLIGETHHDALIFALIVFCIGTVVFVCTMGWREGWKISVGLLLTGYIAILLCSTVAFRK